MKLVDILARELKEWPKDYMGQETEAVTQDKGGELNTLDNGCEPLPKQRKARYWPGSVWTLASIYLKEAEDYETSIVTRSQWQAAVDSLKAREKVWDGETLPPIGQKVKIGDNGGNQTIARFTGKEATIIAHNTTKDGTPTAVFKAFDTEGMPIYHALVAGNGNFEKVRTAEQIAAEEREKEVNRMVATASMLDKGWARKVCADLYDAGYRKQVQP